MTKRERVQAAIHHQPVDRVPISDSFWEDTITRWHAEGLPEGMAPREYFDFDLYPLSIDPSPGFEPELLADEPGWLTLRDRYGYIARKQQGKSRTIDYLSHPVADINAWAEVKKMFDLDDRLARQDGLALIDDVGFPFRTSPSPTWDEAAGKIAMARESDYYLLALAYGPHETCWRLRGFTPTLMDLVERPELLAEISETYMSYLISVIDTCIDRGAGFDGFMMVDDLAATRGMLFSPDAWRQIYRPQVARLGAHLADHEIDFWMHCCGNAEAVFPDLIDCGLKVINPLEAKSGLDVTELRKRYGTRLAYHGNIDAIAMSGPEAELDAELERKLKLFSCTGGYVFHSDHSVPPEVSFNRYRFIIDRALTYGACGG